MHLRGHHFVLLDRRDSHVEAAGDCHRRAVSGVDREAGAPLTTTGFT